MNVTMFMKWFRICSYLCFLFVSVDVLYILYTQPHLPQYSLQSEEQSVAEEAADSVPTGDVFFSIQVLVTWKNTVVLWGGFRREIGASVSPGILQWW